MCGVIIVYSNGCDTFIGLLSLARNHNATLTAVDHWDAHLGLRLTRKELFSTLISRPNCWDLDSLLMPISPGFTISDARHFHAAYQGY